MTEELCKRIAHVAQAILAEQVDLLTGVREIVDLRRGLPEPLISDEDVMTFVAVESELDDVPTGSVRSRWDASALAEKDQRASAILSSAKESIDRACQGVIARFT
jgi:hypothetical protein